MATFKRLDTNLKGFAVKLGKDNQKLSYYFIFKIGRNKINYRLCSSDSTLSHARSLYLKARKIQQAGLDPRTNKEAVSSLTKKKGKTVEQVLKVFEKRHLNNRCSKQTARQYQLILKHFEPSRDINSYTRSDIRDEFEKRTDAGSPIMANRFLAYVGKFFEFAIVRDWYDKNNPAKGIERNIEQARLTTLTDIELKKLWKTLIINEKPSSQRNLFVLMLLTGQRHGAIKQLTKSMVSGEQLNWMPAETKTGHSTGKGQLIPCVGYTATFIHGCSALLVKNSDLLFPNKLGKVFDASALSHWFKEFLVRHNLNTKINPHDLRRTVATQMRQNGFAKSWVKAILDHSERDVMSRHYDMYDMYKEKKDCLEWWDAKLQKLL